MVQKERYGPIEAFEEYYRMGERRSLAKLELILRNAPGRKGPALRTLKGWSTKLEWQEQVTERNGELRRALAEKTTKDITEYKLGFLKQVEQVIATGFEKDGTPMIACEKARDLRDLIEVSLRLMGEEKGEDLNIQFNITRYDDDAKGKGKGKGKGKEEGE